LVGRRAEPADLESLAPVNLAAKHPILNVAGPVMVIPGSRVAAIGWGQPVPEGARCIAGKRATEA